MPRPISDEELQLKKRARRRLVGAIALVVLVAIFLPMFLEREPKPLGQDIDIQIPAQDKGQFTSKIIPVPDKVNIQKPVPAMPVETVVEKPPVVEEKAVVVEAKKPEAVPVPVIKVEPPVEKVEKPKAETKPAIKSGKETFMIPLAAFTNPANAKQLQAKLKASGIKSYTEILKTNEGDKTRVRAGPFPTREAAERVREKLKAQGLNGNVGVIK